MINKNFDWVALLAILHGITSVHNSKDGYIFDSGNKSYKLNLDGKSAVFFELSNKQQAVAIVGSANKMHEISKIDKIMADQIAMQEYLAPIKTICNQVNAIVNYGNTYHFNLVDGRFGTILVGKSHVKYEVRDKNSKPVASSDVYNVSAERIAAIVQMLSKSVSYCNMATKSINAQKQR